MPERQYRIHPAIGIARVGDAVRTDASKDFYFIGPESPEYQAETSGGAEKNACAGPWPVTRQRRAYRNRSAFRHRSRSEANHAERRNKADNPDPRRTAVGCRWPLDGHRRNGAKRF